MTLRLSILCALLLAVPAMATTYYVATNGNNSWDGSAPTYVSGTTGPFADFYPINWGSAHALQPGDTLYVRGGVWNHTNDGLNNRLLVANVSASQASPIVVSNYPGEYPIIYGSGPNNNAIQLTACSWVKIFGINVTNAYRSVLCFGVTNCEIAYCDFGGGDTSVGCCLAVFSMYSSSQSNWVHNCTIHDGGVDPTAVQGSGHSATFGLFYSTNDCTAYNIIESNNLYHAGHDTLSVYGQNNLVQYNFMHNEPWYFMTTNINQEVGMRDMELGGEYCVGNIAQYNRCQYAGITPNSGSHGIEFDGASLNIMRMNTLANNDFAGLVIYPKPGTANWYFGSNYFYNNTIVGNGFGSTNLNQTYEWSVASVMTTGTTNNFFVNNLYWGNETNYYSGVALLMVNNSSGIGLWRNNLTNVNPMFADTTLGGPFSQTQPDYHLTTGSPAIDAGVFLTTITSASGSSTTFNVGDANYFYAGLTAAGHTIPGDTIQLQGQTNTVTITSISGNTLTVNSSVTWTNGQGVALSYSGSAPDVGAFEFMTSQPTTNLIPAGAVYDVAGRYYLRGSDGYNPNATILQLGGTYLMTFGANEFRLSPFGGANVMGPSYQWTYPDPAVGDLGSWLVGTSPGAPVTAILTSNTPPTGLKVYAPVRK